MIFFKKNQSLACDTCNLFFSYLKKENSCGHLSFVVVFSFFSMKEVKKLHQSRPAFDFFHRIVRNRNT